MITSVLLLLMLSDPAVASAPLARKVEATRLIGGCGCTFWRTDPAEAMNVGNAVFFSEGSGRPALMNLEGRDIWLAAADPDANDDWGAVAGDARVVEYAACDYKVSVHQELAPSDCPKPDEDCEYVNMVGTITITAGNRRETFRIIGACGC